MIWVTTSDNNILLVKKDLEKLIWIFQFFSFYFSTFYFSITELSCLLKYKRKKQTETGPTHPN